jgi:hypothetical protein
MVVTAAQDGDMVGEQHIVAKSGVADNTAVAHEDIVTYLSLGINKYGSDARYKIRTAP